MVLPSRSSQQSLNDTISPDVSEAIARLYRYIPNSSVLAEWVTTHDNQCVVRATVHIGTIPFASSMAMDASIEQAEDRAKIRAIASALVSYLPHEPFDSENRTDVSQIPQMNEPPSSHDRSAQPAEKTAPLDATTQLLSKNQSIVSSEDGADDDWMTDMDTPDAPPPPSALDLSHQDRDEALQIESSHELDDSKPSTSIQPSPKRKTGKKAPSSETQPKSNKVKSAASSAQAPPSSAIESTPLPSDSTAQSLGVDLSDIIAKTSVELKRLGWTDVQGREHLQKVYGKRSRQQLTDPELLDFLTHLESL
ncbi:MAG: hypothetical protein AAFR31_14480 [Cyanobacteria bacterium J06627_8]